MAVYKTSHKLLKVVGLC